jgi:predicted tellurium resistance membrane protein TerC
MEAFMTANFWLAVGQIIMIDILLGGDNAVVIALACRQLPAHLRLQRHTVGNCWRIVLRVVLIAFALTLLDSLRRLVGAALLLWIHDCWRHKDEDGHAHIRAATSCGQQSRR